MTSCHLSTKVSTFESWECSKKKTTFFGPTKKHRKTPPHTKEEQKKICPSKYSQKRCVCVCKYVYCLRTNSSANLQYIWRIFLEKKSKYHVATIYFHTKQMIQTLNLTWIHTIWPWWSDTHPSIFSPEIRATMFSIIGIEELSQTSA